MTDDGVLKNCIYCNGGMGYDADLNCALAYRRPKYTCKKCKNSWDESIWEQLSVAYAKGQSKAHSLCCPTDQNESAECIYYENLRLKDERKQIIEKLRELHQLWLENKEAQVNVCFLKLFKKLKLRLR